MMSGGRFNERADNAARSFVEEDIDQILSTRTTRISSDKTEEQKKADAIFSKAVFSSVDSGLSLSLSLSFSLFLSFFSVSSCDKCI